jgi:outer membrane protein assembly factor BamB
VRWAVPLPGSWIAETSVLGTVPAAPAGTGQPGTGQPGTGQPGTGQPGTGQPGTGQAYAAAGTAVAALGSGMTVYGYDLRTGHPLWTTGLPGFPAGYRVVSVRVWPGVVTAGVAGPPPAGAAAGPQRTVVLSASSGRQLRSFAAAPFGGAVAADAGHTVVIGPAAVTSYANATGRVSWTRPTGSATQDWQAGGGYLYLTDAAGGNLGTGPVALLRRISLRTGAERLVRPAAGSFSGRLGAAVDGVVLFSGARGVTAYAGSTGKFLWRREGAAPDSADLVRRLFYLTVGSALTGVQPWTGRVESKVSGADGSGSAGVYGVRDGVALGLDEGPLGQAWGYDVATQRVIWNTRTLPWPHYFVDLSGIGGSADPGSGSVLLTACEQRVQVGGEQICRRPELVLIDR